MSDRKPDFWVVKRDGIDGVTEYLTHEDPEVYWSYDIKAWRYALSIHGRGLSTSVGIHTREMLVDAFTAGHRAGARSARRAGR